MSSPSLKQLYQDHQGKVSDKWTSYIEKYEELFRPYRDKEISLLEIGVQNGGSLEIYAKYFQQAKALVGCDIDELCGTLEYEDSCISIVVGDANSKESEQKILDTSPTFDIIIDDGSHHSKDIVSSFSRYFKHLKLNGKYIIEDLHCSYWGHFDGGLFKPTSSNSFFKLLSDIVNHEHWGVDKRRTDLLVSFSEQYLIDFNEDVLAQIHAITFTNSMCVVEKKQQASNELGARFVAGSQEQFDKGRKALHEKNNVTPSQKNNIWAEATSVEKMVDVKNQRITHLKAALKEKNVETLRLETTLKEKSAQVADLEQRLSTIALEKDSLALEKDSLALEKDSLALEKDSLALEKDSLALEKDSLALEKDSLALEKDSLSADIAVLLKSNSWKLTAPLRFISHKFFRRSLK